MREIGKLREDCARTVKPDKVTEYIAGSVFMDNELQFLPQEEGRISYAAAVGSVPAKLSYDYFIKDHLGNVRMVLTEGERIDAYPAASLETNNLATERQLYSKVDDGRVNKGTVSGYPTDNYTSPNDFIQKLNGSGVKVGTGMLLKVMAGDAFNYRVSSWWNSGSSPNPPADPLTDLITALSGSIGAVSNKFSLSDLSGSSVLSGSITSFLNGRSYRTDKPKAYVQWVLLDEQLGYESGSSGAAQVGSSNSFTVHTGTNIGISKNGYLYIYVSNETPNIDVFFDNLQVTHVHGAILEETHYYPFGLTMAGISSSAMNFGKENKIKFQSQEFATKEFSDGSGLEVYEFRYRMDDPQIGRFWSIDPLAEKYDYNSVYAFSENKVTSHIELEGLEALSTADLWRSAGITSSTDPKQFVKDVGKEAVKPKNWADAAVITGQIVLPVVFTTIMTGGVGDGAILSAETSALRTTTTEVSTGPTILQNAARGKEFEQAVVANLAKEGHTNIVEQVSIKADNGIKTRVDAVSINAEGRMALTESKSSSTAPLTPNQKATYPSIAQSGGVVVGNGKPGYPGGTIIPATKVNIVRPPIPRAVSDATYLRPPISFPIEKIKRQN